MNQTSGHEASAAVISSCSQKPAAHRTNEPPTDDAWTNFRTASSCHDDTLSRPVAQTIAARRLTKRGLDLAVSLRTASSRSKTVAIAESTVACRRCHAEAKAYLAEAMSLFWDQTEAENFEKCGEAAVRGYLWGLVAAAAHVDATWNAQRSRRRRHGWIACSMAGPVA